MLDFLIYEAKVAVALAIFYMFFRLLLKKETFHRFNRIVLLTASTLSFVLPFCIITVRKTMELPDIQVGEITAEPVVASVAAEAAPSVPWWSVALAVIFFMGVLYVLVRLVVSVLSICRIVRQGELVGTEDGCKIIVTDRDIDPFSWMRYIVLSRQDWDGHHAPIITHEKAHITYGHSVDLLLVDFLSAFQWFNPAIWMLRADLQELHEYEADDAVLRSGANLKEYQYLLIRKAVSKSGYSVANSFNHSILKNRITMMSKSKSPLMRGLRVLYLLPLVCLGLSLQAQTVFVPADKGSVKVRVTQEGAAPLCILRQASGEEKEISQEELGAIDPATIDSMEVLKDTESTAKYGEKGKNGVVIVKLREFNASLQYDKVSDAAPAPAVQVRPVALGANPDMLFIQREAWGEEKELTAEEVASLSSSRIQSMKILKDEKSLKKYGNKARDGVVVIQMKAPMEMDEIVVVSYRDEKDEEPISFRLIPDKMPRFQGGDLNAFSKWLIRQIDVPKDCNHSGKMRVAFEVFADGTVGDVEILESVCPELDALVKEAILKSPKWEPGTARDGKAIATNLRLPVIFQVRPLPEGK